MVLEAFKNAYEKRNQPDNLIFHRDYAEFGIKQIEDLYFLILYQLSLILKLGNKLRMSSTVILKTLTKRPSVRGIMNSFATFLPKKKSFDNRTAEDIALMMDHINSYGWAMLNDKAPIEMFDFIQTHMNI